MNLKSYECYDLFVSSTPQFFLCMGEENFNLCCVFFLQILFSLAKSPLYSPYFSHHGPVGSASTGRHEVVGSAKFLAENIPVLSGRLVEIQIVTV